MHWHLESRLPVAVTILGPYLVLSTSGGPLAGSHPRCPKTHRRNAKSSLRTEGDIFLIRSVRTVKFKFNVIEKDSCESSIVAQDTGNLTVFDRMSII